MDDLYVFIARSGTCITPRWSRGIPFLIHSKE